MQCNNAACAWWADGVPRATVLEHSFVWPSESLARRKPFREQAWRLVGPSNRVLVCEIVGAPTGLEVHARYDLEADPVRTQPTGSLVEARVVAAQWSEAALGLGSFLELDLDA
jgi:hypothetical protein